MPTRLFLGALSLAAVAAVLLLVRSGQAAESSAPESPASQSAEPSLIGPATLKSLAAALTAQDREEAGMLTWRILAIMARAHAGGTGPSDYLGAAYRAEKLSPAESVAVQRCLLGVWSAAQGMALFTPENLALMDRGQSPRVTRGLQQGLPVIFDTGPPPDMTMKLKVGPKNFDRTRVAVEPPLPTRTSQTTPVPAATPPPYIIKTFEVRLGETLALDQCGLTYWDLRLDRVDRDKRVSFNFAHRLANKFKLVDRYEPATGTWTKDRETSFPTAFSVAFTPERIPDTNLRGVKLQNAKFVTIYLDENLGAQVTYRLHVRLPRQITTIDQLSPEDRHYYFGYEPPGLSIPGQQSPATPAPAKLR